MPASHQPSHYEVLSLPAPSIDGGMSPEVLTSHLVKKAYHRALLRWHPDKSMSALNSTANPGEEPISASPAGYTLDEIITAYTTLSTDRGRREYEREYRLGLLNATRPKDQQILYAPVDVVDLDDFDYDEDKELFTRPCRCGEEKGYMISERDLEDDPSGEVVVGCFGCSLWLRVAFEVVAVGFPRMDSDSEEESSKVKGAAEEGFPAEGPIGQA
ncbi:CSL zinc finger-domain-containing protein [Kalaharituber pfeilii]|nr:CSL zinc finger-domain-containing protein [Kalaharituber pfeilii]